MRGENVDGLHNIADIGINFLVSFSGNWLGAKLIPVNKGWFKPQKFLSVFTKPYGQKILLQINVGTLVSSSVNLKQFYWNRVKSRKLTPV